MIGLPAGMGEESRLAYQFALELAKELIALSTGIITLVVAFSKDIFKRTPSLPARAVLTAALICYLISMWFGIGHIQSLTGSLEWAAIEISADSARGISVSANQFLHLPDSDSTARDSAREHLSNEGVIIGESAKADALRQIWFFFSGTVLVVLYSTLMLMSLRRLGSSGARREGHEAQAPISAATTTPKAHQRAGA